MRKCGTKIHANRMSSWSIIFEQRLVYRRRGRKILKFFWLGVRQVRAFCIPNSVSNFDCFENGDNREFFGLEERGGRWFDPQTLQMIVNVGLA